MKKRLNKKGFIILPILGVIAVISLLVAGAYIADATGILTLSSAKTCTETPVNKDCYCIEEDEKIQVRRGIIPKWICEKKDKFINPLDANWEQQAINYATQKLSEDFPECNSESCANGEWRVELGIKDHEERVISVECWNLDQRFANVNFDLVDGEISWFSCSNYYVPQEGNPLIELWEEKGTLTKIKYRIKCSLGTGIAQGTYNYVLPETQVDREEWRFLGRDVGELKSIRFGTCDLINPTSRGLTIECEAECTGYSDWGGEFSITSDKVPNVCGNGILDIGESCDDGNLNNGDGCSDKCTID